MSPGVPLLSLQAIAGAQERPPDRILLGVQTVRTGRNSIARSSRRTRGDRWTDCDASATASCPGYLPPTTARVKYIPDFSERDAALDAHAQAYLATARTQLSATLPAETRVATLAGLRLPAYATEGAPIWSW